MTRRRDGRNGECNRGLYDSVYNASMPKKIKRNHLQILLALADAPKNGLEIMREVLETTGGRLTLWPGTLYGSLKELSRQGCVVEVPAEGQEIRGGSPRYYRMTARGSSLLKEELQSLEEVLEVARRKRFLEQES